MVGAALFLFGFFDFLPHLPDFLLGRFRKLCHFILKLADIIEIYADVLDCVSRPFLVALMHFNPADKLVENGGGKLGKGGKRHVAFCSEYHKGKAKNPKCHSPHIMDADLLMQTVAEVLKKIEDYSISNRAEFEALVKKNLAMQQTDQTKKQQKRIPQITTRLEQIERC